MPWVSLQKAPPRRFVDNSPPDAGAQQTHRVADAVFPHLRALWAAVFAFAQDDLPLAPLRRALAEGNVPRVLALVQASWETAQQQALLAPLEGLLLETVAGAGVAAVSNTSTILGAKATAQGVRIAFNTGHPGVTQNVRQLLAQEVREIDDATRRGIQAIVGRSFEGGLTVQRQARQIETLIGLTERQAQAVFTYRAELMESWVQPDDTPRQREQMLQRIERRVEQRARQKLRQRAIAIARTESLSASSLGSEILWQQLQDQGILNAEKYKRFWIIATKDERICPICRNIPSLNNEGRFIGELFIIPGGSILHPPAHVQCRCAITLRRVNI